MRSFEAVRHTEVVARSDVSSLDAAALTALLRQISQLEAWLTERKVAVVRGLEELRGSGAAGRIEVTAGQVFGKTEARRLSQRAEVLESAPAMEAVLGEGLITPAHVDAMAAAVKMTPQVVEHQEDLARAAVTLTPDEFAAMCKRTAFFADPDGGVTTLEKQRRLSKVKRWIDPYSGMYFLKAELDPERGAQVWAALDKEIEAHFHLGADAGIDNDQRAAAALHTIVATGGRRTGATVHVHIDLPTLRQGLHDNSTIEITGGGELPVDTIRRMACEADLVPYVLSGDGVVVDVGRARRLATARQRQALRAMYPTCAIDGCGVRFEHTRIHHLQPFENGGATDMSNLLPLCDRHHHDAHEGQWRLSLDPATRELTVTRPDGTVTHTALRRRAAA